MDTLTTRPAAPATVLTRARLRLAGVLATVAAIVIGAVSPASASTGVETAVNGGFGSVNGLILGVLAAGFFLVTISGLGIAMGARWLQKAGRRA